MAGLESGSSSFEKEWTLGVTDPSSGVTGGDGGDTMPEYFQSRTEKLKLFSNIRDNLSPYPSPSGLSGANWDMSPISGAEKFTGVHIKGTIIYNGSPLSGVSKAIEAGQVAESSTTDGNISFNAPPPGGAFVGANAVTEDGFGYGYRFEPSVQGIPYTNSVDSGYKLDFGTVYYGSVDGSITDYSGNPLEGEIVEVNGVPFATDGQGQWSSLGPGGQTGTMKALQGSYTQDVTLGTGQSIDISYPRLKVRALDGNLEPLDKTPIKVNGELYQTNDKGIVVLDEIPLQEHTVLVQELLVSNVLVDQVGTLYKTVISPYQNDNPSDEQNVRQINVVVIDGKTGKPVNDVNLAEIKSGSQTETKEDGEGNLLVLSQEEGIQMVIGRNDNRFENQFVEGDVDELKETLTLEVPRKPAVGNK